jgi:hypothetical protein
MATYNRNEDPGLAQHDVRAEAAARNQGSAVERAASSGDNLDTLTKDQLLQEAEARGVEVKTSATKDEILAALRT